MALLWGKNRNMKPSFISEKPSPAIRIKLQDFAQVLVRNIKESSLHTFLHKRAGAGMTVEATLVIPVFLLFFLNLASFMEIIRLHGSVQFALWKTGNRAALYAGALEDMAGSSLLSAFYMKSQITETLGEAYLEDSPMVKGASGMLVFTNPLQESEDVLDITVTYQVEPMSGLIGFPTFYLSNHYYTHLWNGYEITGAGAGMEMVYVTEAGSVYHCDRNCTYLVVSVQQVTAAGVGELRNQWGRAYGPCARCAKGGMPDGLYITTEGECYHYNGTCPALKRTVFSVALSEARKRYRECSRCGGN